MKILILTQSYITKEAFDQAYAHTRALGYAKNGQKVVVLSFSAPTAYEVDKIPVMSEKTFYKSYNVKEFDIVASHAPNLRNHFRFIFKT
jgi:hypothetical protein